MLVNSVKLLIGCVALLAAPAFATTYVADSNVQPASVAGTWNYSDDPQPVAGTSLSGQFTLPTTVAPFSENFGLGNDYGSASVSPSVGQTPDGPEPIISGTVAADSQGYYVNSGVDVSLDYYYEVEGPSTNAQIPIDIDATLGYTMTSIDDSVDLEVDDSRLALTFLKAGNSYTSAPLQYSFSQTIGPNSYNGVYLNQVNEIQFTLDIVAGSTGPLEGYTPSGFQEVTGFVDPTISIDPSFADASLYSIAVNPVDLPESGEYLIVLSTLLMLLQRPRFFAIQ